MSKRIPSNYLKLALSLVVVILIVSKYFYINKVQLDVDVLTKQLDPLKKSAQLYTRIGYKSSPRYESIYGPVTFVMVPYIVEQNSIPDTLIVIKDKGELINGLNNYRVISQNSEGERIVSLMCKIK